MPPPPQQQEYAYSAAVRQSVEVVFPIAPHMTWDGYMRLLYDRSNRAIQAQANILLQRGNISAQEVRSLVEGQRNRAVLAFRDRLSPFGRLYSEILKPGKSLPTLEEMLRRKGTLEGVLTSVGKSRTVVNRIAVVSRVGGPATIVLQISFSAVAIYTAAPADRGRVTAREVGGIAGGVAGGIGGAWAGCATFAAFASPSLVLPVVGEVTTGGACFVGGILGGIGVGWLGHRAGSAAGVAAYNFATDFHWIGN
jgi:hypothetical protein